MGRINFDFDAKCRLLTFRNQWRSTFGPLKPSQLWVAETHNHLQASDSPARKSGLFFGEQQLRCSASHLKALNPPETAWNWVISARIREFKAAISTVSPRLAARRIREFSIWTW
jgi:hypothetical protein